MDTMFPLFPHRRISFRTAYLLVLISAAAVVFSFAMVAGIKAVFPASETVQRTTDHRIVKQLTLAYTVGAMAFWVVEELIFRGYLLQKLRRRLSFRAALLISSAAFSAEHVFGGVPIMVLGFVMSLWFGWLMMKANSIIAPIIAHWAFDFSALYIYLPLKGITEMAASGQTPQLGAAIFPWYMYLIAAVVLVVCVVALRRELAKQPSRSAITGEDLAGRLAIAM